MKPGAARAAAIARIMIHGPLGTGSRIRRGMPGPAPSGTDVIAKYGPRSTRRLSTAERVTEVRLTCSDPALARCRGRWLEGPSQVEHQVAARLRTADQRAAVGGVIDRIRGIADRSGQQARLTGVAYAGAA